MGIMKDIMSINEIDCANEELVAFWVNDILEYFDLPYSMQCVKGMYTGVNSSPNLNKEQLFKLGSEQGVLKVLNRLKDYFEKQKKDYDKWIIKYPNDYDACAEEHYFKEVEKKIMEWLKEFEVKK